MVAPSDGGFSSDSVSSGDEDEGDLAMKAKRGVTGGRVGGGRAGAGEREGDESLDDEEEQRGVVKKLRWRTEVGRMG